MTIHYKKKGSLQYPRSLCNHSGMGKVTENLKDVDCKSCLISSKSQPTQEADRVNRVGKKRDSGYTARMAGQTKEAK